jgi:uncharacterized surface anchored protein
VRYTVSTEHATDNVITIIIPKTFTDYCNGDKYSLGKNPTFDEKIQSSSYHNQTTVDPNYNLNIVLNNQNDWRETVTDLVVQENSNDGDGKVYHYTYYVEETHIPDGFEVSYKDMHGNISSVPSNIDVNTNGSLTVVNKSICTNLEIKKVRKEQISVDNPSTLTGAVFRIEKYSSSDYQSKDTSWRTTGEVYVEDTNNDGIYEIDGLSAGYYKIVETVVPDGYIKLSEDPKFVVEYDSTNKEYSIS